MQREVDKLVLENSGDKGLGERYKRCRMQKFGWVMLVERWQRGASLYSRPECIQVRAE